MKVQKIIIQNSNKTTWMVLDDDYLPIKPIQQYLNYLESTAKSPNTIRSYAHHLKLYWEYLGDKSLEWDKVGIEDLAFFIGWLQRGDRGNAISLEVIEIKRVERTVNLIISAVTMMYDYQYRLGSIKSLDLYREQPAFYSKYKSFLHHINKSKTINSKLLKLKEPKRFPKTLTAGQIKTIIYACKRLRDKFLISLLYESGMRIGQALGLRHEDIHSWDNEIIINPRDDNENSARAKTDEQIRIDVSKDLIALYTDYLLKEYGNLDSDYVFINLWGGKIGSPMKYGSVKTFFERLIKKTGISLSPHTLRHTHATELLRDGWDISYLQKRLGHKDIQTTINTYSHLTNEDLKKEYKKYLKRRDNEKNY